jgi:hypothetical protein
LREGGILNSAVDGTDVPSNCLLRADFDYLCNNGIFDGSITHPRDFHYPTHLAPGSSSAPIGREVGSHAGTISPLRQLYPWLIELMNVAFYNYHYRIHEVYLRRQLSASVRRASGRSLNSTPGWRGKHLTAYVRSGGVGKILIKYLKTFSDSHVMEHPLELTEAFHKSVLPALWFRTDTHLSQSHDAVFHLLYHGIVPVVLKMIVGSLLAFKGMKGKFQTLCDPILNHIHSL